MANYVSWLEHGSKNDFVSHSRVSWPINIKKIRKPFFNDEYRVFRLWIRKPDKYWLSVVHKPVTNVYEGFQLTIRKGHMIWWKTHIFKLNYFHVIHVLVSKKLIAHDVPQRFVVHMVIGLSCCCSALVDLLVNKEKYYPDA